MKWSTILLVLAQFFNTGAKLVLFILLTRLGGFEVAGSYTYTLSVVTPAFILFGVSLRQIFVTAPTAVHYKHFLFLRCLYGSCGIVLVLVFGMLIRPEMFLLFAAMAGYRFVEALIDLRIAFFQRSSRVSLMALSTFSMSIIMTGSLSVAFVQTGQLPLSVSIASVFGLLVYFGLSQIVSGRKSDGPPPTLTFREAKQISKNGLYISISAFLVSLGTSIPVLILGEVADNAAVGVYSAIYNLVSISTILFGAVSQAELRSFSTLAEQHDFKKFLRRANKYSFTLSLSGILIAIPIYLFGVDVFSLVFGQDFSGYLGAMMVMSMTICIAPFGFFRDVQLTALQRFSVQTKISTVTLALTVLSGMLLVPYLSVMGATLTVFLTMLIRNTVKSIVVNRVARDMR